MSETSQQERPGKSKFKSKTMWVNALTAVCTLAALFGFDIDIPAEEKAQLAGSIVVLVNLVNMVLRWVTTEPISKGK